MSKVFGYCANVHDEVQMECDPKYSDELGKSFADCIVQAGINLGVKTELAGKYDIGGNWSETH